MGQSPLAFLAQRAYALLGANPVAAGAFANGAVGQQAELWTSDRHAVNYAASYAKAVGMAANTAGVTTTVGVATTYVGLCLSNPKANNKNLAILHVGGLLNVAPAALTDAFLAVGFNAGTDVTHTTPITPRNAFVGSDSVTANLTATVDSSATLPTAPTFARVLTGATLATSAFAFSAAIDGGIILPPGGYAIIATNIAGPASGFLGSFMWEEVPV